MKWFWDSLIYVLCTLAVALIIAAIWHPAPPIPIQDTAERERTTPHTYDNYLESDKR